MYTRISVLLGKRMEEAKWILESYNYNRFAIGKNVEMSSYYLYLDDPACPMIRSGQRRVAEELSKILYEASGQLEDSVYAGECRLRVQDHTANASGHWSNSFTW